MLKGGIRIMNFNATFNKI